MPENLIANCPTPGQVLEGHVQRCDRLLSLLGSQPVGFTWGYDLARQHGRQFSKGEGINLYMEVGTVAWRQCRLSAFSLSALLSLCSCG